MRAHYFFGPFKDSKANHPVLEACLKVMLVRREGVGFLGDIKMHNDEERNMKMDFRLREHTSTPLCQVGDCALQLMEQVLAWLGMPRWLMPRSLEKLMES